MENNLTISFFGAPNSGKSTLFNELLNKHVAIISDKPQTTNRITTGILNIGPFTINLYDTPGISFIKNTGLRGVLNEISWEQLNNNNNNYNFFLVPANKLTIPQEFVDKVDNLIIIITKIDMIKKERVPFLIEKINDLYQPKDILCVSAKYDKGVDYLLNYFLSLPQRFSMSDKEKLDLTPKDFLEDFTISTFVKEDNEQLAVDMTREAIFNVLKKEVPYYIEIENINWKEGPKGVHIEQILLVPNMQYRIIIYGNQNLEKIKKQSVENLSQLWHKEVFLKMSVKIKK
jgi:small GTP-binding protein